MVLSMNELSNNLIDITKREHEVLLSTIASNAEYYTVTDNVVDYLWYYVSGFDLEHGVVFTLFLGQFRKAITQTLLSILRLHSVQGFLTLRHALESAALACYALYDTDLKSFCSVDNYERVVPLKNLKQKAYKWLENKMPEYSNHLKLRKKMINDYWAHSSLLPTTQNFEMEGDIADTVYFDKKDSDIIDQYLLVLSDITFSFIAASSQLNTQFKRFQISGEFHQKMTDLQQKLNNLREQSKSNYRIYRWKDVPE